jgi:hypothetical protein
LANAKLAPLQSLRAQSFGREVVFVDTAKAGEEGNFKLIQQLVIDLVVQDHVALINNYRERLLISVSSAKRSVQNLDRQLQTVTEQLANLAQRTASQDQSLDIFRHNLSQIIRGKPVSDNVTDEAQIRELRERIASEEVFRRNDDELKSRLNTVFAELQQSKEDKLRLVANTDQELSVIKSTKASLAPSRIPVVVGTKKILLLLSAAVASVLFALFLVLIVDRASRGATTPTAVRETESVMGLRKIP